MLRLLALVLLLSALALSAYHRARARRDGETVSRSREGSAFLLLRGVLALALFGSILAHIFKPEWMTWATIQLGRPLRWLGFLLGLLAVPAIHWVLRSLGRNVTETVLTKEHHELVTQGPYRWMRHPLYTTGLVLFLGLGLMTSSWLVLGATALAFVLIRVLVIPREEQALLAKFGERYQVYMLTTGRLLPKLDDLALIRVATWTAAALALGWIITVGALAFSDEGHPPLWYYLGAFVVLASSFLAPIGTGAALAGIWRSRRAHTQLPPRAVAVLGVNLLFLTIAVGLWLWIMWQTYRLDD
jgi:protein-S-isoprenylcysteine O-methyltransferase Ste14